MLPSQVNPLLIFMGVTDNAGNAVFLVDSTLKTTGEGKCKPSHGDCAFLYLGAGAEQEFTNEDGDSYRLLINEIRKVKVGDQVRHRRQRRQGAASPRARRSVTEAARRFAFPAADRRRGRVRLDEWKLNRRRLAPIEGVWQCAVSSPSACSRYRPWLFSPPRRSRAPRRRTGQAEDHARHARCASASASC